MLELAKMRLAKTTKTTIPNIKAKTRLPDESKKNDSTHIMKKKAHELKTGDTYQHQRRRRAPRIHCSEGPRKAPTCTAPAPPPKIYQ